MNTKQIAAIVIVAALACAGIGAAYAYSAQLTTEQNTVESHHLVLDHSGEFNDMLSSDKIQYDSETTAQNTAIYTPYGAAPIYRDLVGTQVNTNDQLVSQPFNVTIDSSLMEEDNWFTFYVKTTEINGQVKDFAGAYAIVFTYKTDLNKDGDYADDNEQMIDYVLLKGTGVTASGITNLYPMFTSPQILSSSYQNVDIDLYALPYEGTIGQASPDYDGVAFEFYAITVASTPAEIEALDTTDSTALSVQDKSGTAYGTGIEAAAYLQGHGRLAVPATTSTAGTYTFANLLTSITSEDNLALTFSASETKTVEDKQVQTGRIYKDVSTDSANIVKNVPQELIVVVDATQLPTYQTFKIDDKTKTEIQTAMLGVVEIKAVYDAETSVDVESDIAFDFGTGIAFDETSQKIKTDGTTLGFHYVTFSYTQENGDGDDDDVTVTSGIWIKIAAAEA